MAGSEPAFLTKLSWNLPWLVRYPFVRARSYLQQTAFEKKHVVITIANHFEPGWSPNGVLDHRVQIKRLRAYRHMAREIGDAVRDADGTKFRHTNFYPAEQYHPEILELLAEMQADGLGETEVHLHHGVDRPDTAENLRNVLVDFRDTLAEKHKLLSTNGDGQPKYAFVHGNLALGNSCGGRFCGVDNEMEVLQDTGCYVDMTLPSAPDQSQVGVINRIYECGLPLSSSTPHRRARPPLSNGKGPQLPLIFQGPLVLRWTPRPRIDDGALTASQGLGRSRFDRWLSANVTACGRSDIVFVKLYCHGFFDGDQPACIGEEAKAFFGELVNESAKSGRAQIHFATAREAFNIAMAAIEGLRGGPNEFRDHKLRPIMQSVI